MSAMPDVSVVICAYTSARWQRLVNAVASVRAPPAPAAELVPMVATTRRCWTVPGLTFRSTRPFRTPGSGDSPGPATAGSPR